MLRLIGGAKGLPGDLVHRIRANWGVPKDDSTGVGESKGDDAGGAPTAGVARRKNRRRRRKKGTAERA